uniref:Activin_recp domain-containing protein n=1 Tax=Angiostrongylus cantonensis TaxID=6313 RepID=A0A158PBZ2_ANGCA
LLFAFIFASNAMCYSEYYAVNRSGTVRQYFDRFCVHREHCVNRGIDEQCQTLQQLDRRIQVSFFSYHHTRPSRRALVQSRFCCCETDRCNNFNNQMAYEIFVQDSPDIRNVLNVQIILKIQSITREKEG